MLASIVTPVLADCTVTPNGSGSDYVCTNTTIAVTGTPNNDNIINHGTISTYMWGGGFSANPAQQDTLTNNGIVGNAEDDDGIWGGAGNDTIINNGVVYGGPWTQWNGVNGAIFGDDSIGFADDDTIINNNISHGNIHGDYSAGGDDTIRINGRVNGGVYGEGPDSVLAGRFGNDTVILTNNAVVTTIIDGMGGTDRLRFEFSVADEATYNSLSSLIANANPASGSLTFNGNTFNWVNFEILENAIVWSGGQPNQPPTAAIAAPTQGQIFTADGTGSANVTLSAVGSSDSDGTIVSYAWSWTGTSSGTASGLTVPQSFGVGSYSLTLTVTDDAGATDTEVRSFSVQAPTGTITLALQPTGSANDVNEDGNNLHTSGGLWIGNASSAANSWLGLRYTGVNIPPGATINSAYLEVYATATQWITVNVSIRGEAADNSSIFNSTSKPSQRPLTAAATSYNMNENWTANSWHNLGNITSVIQEIVNRPNWQSGNSLSLLIKGLGSAWARKNIASFDTNAAFAPRLVITYVASTPSNQPPTAAIAAPTEGQVFTADDMGNAVVTLDATGSSDSDGTIVSYAWSWTGTASGAASGSSATPTFGVGSYTLTLTVTDDDGATDTEIRTFSVEAAPPPNQPPTAAIAAPTEGQVFTADGTGNAVVTLDATGSSDSDGMIVSYAWSWTGTASGAASGSSATPTFGVGSYTLTLTVTDNDGATDTEIRTFSVEPAPPPNQPPTAAITAPTEGQVFTADGTGNAVVSLDATGSSDSDGMIVSYAWSWTGAASGAASGSSATPTFGVGSYTLTLSVTDNDGATDTEIRTFSVEAAPPPNQPPTAVIAAPTEGQVFTADGTGNAVVSLDAAGSSDSDGMIVSYAWSWTGAASGAASGSNATPTFGVGSYTLTLTVTDDDGATDTEIRTFSVEAAPPPNQPPTAVIAAPTEGQAFTADGTGNAVVTLNAAGSSDSDGMIVSYAWSWTGTSSGTTNGGATAQSFGVGSYTLTLTVTDDDGATDTETRAFSVEPAPNLPPVIDPIAPQSTRQGVTITPLTISASDPNDDPLTYAVTNLPDGLSFNPATRQVTGTVDANATTRTVTVSVSDGVNPPTTLDFVWTIVDDLPPTFTPANQTHTVGAVINLSLMSFASDPEGLPLRFNLTAGSLPSGLTLQTTGEVTGTIGGSAMVYTPTIEVIDSVGQSVSASFTWTVQDAPSGPVTLELQTAASSDDVNEDGTTYTSTGIMWIGNGSSSSNSWVGLRFTGVTIPQGATINSARVEVFSIANQWIAINMNVAGHAVDNSPTFSSSNKPSQRPLTTARLVYNTNEQWSLYNWHSLGSVANIVQEIVNRPGWQSGNSLSLLMKGTSAAWARKFIASFDNDPIYAPRLIIEYTVDGMAMAATSQMMAPQQTIVVPPVTPPVAAFTGTPLAGEAPLSVQFSNASTGGDTYSWDFGDGTTSTEANPVKVYTQPGSYTVVLTVTNAGGTASAQATIVVNAPAEVTSEAPAEVAPPPTEPPSEPVPTVTETPAEPPGGTNSRTSTLTHRVTG